MLKGETGKKHLLVAVTCSQSLDHKGVVQQLYQRATDCEKQDFDELKKFLLAERGLLLASAQ